MPSFMLLLHRPAERARPTADAETVATVSYTHLTLPTKA